MKVERLRIHNYRSIRDIDLKVTDLQVFIGPNNHGKSNILAALEFGLTPSAKVEPNDFFSCRPDGDGVLWIEITFIHLTPQEERTFQKYVRADRTMCIRKTAELLEKDKVEITYNGYIQEPNLWWLQHSAGERLSTRELIQKEADQVPALQPLLEKSGKIGQKQVTEFQTQYIQAHRNELEFTEVLESGPLLGPKNVGGGVLPDLYLIPAVRDLSDEAKIRTTTSFGRLLQHTVKEMAKKDPKFFELRQNLAQLIDRLNVRDTASSRGPSSGLQELEHQLESELVSWRVQVSIEVSPPDLEKVFELGTTLHLDEGGLRTPADRKGHGLQRAVIFAFLRAWARAIRPDPSLGEVKSREASESVYFAMEEPELFLHPHAQRQLFASLRDISEDPSHQVFICTHSTHFVDLDYYKEIAIVTKPNAMTGTTIRQCTEELFGGGQPTDRKDRFHMAYWVNPDRAEFFFARKVVLVEGETEKAIFPFLAEKLACLDHNVSLIDCGSKHNLELYAMILNAFKIPYCVVHDEDPLPVPIPPEWKPQRIKERELLYQINTELAALAIAGTGHAEVLSPDFEGVSGISRRQGEIKGKVLAALDHFQALGNKEIPPTLSQAVKNAYDLSLPPLEKK